MVEFDKIVEEMDGLSRQQWIQLILLMLPAVFVGSQMGAMVFIGASVDYTCEMPIKDNLVEMCGRNWTDQQTSMYVSQPNSCKRYSFTDTDVTNCSYWWPGNDTVTKPNKTEQCTSWSFDTSSMFKSSVVSDFLLVCQDEYKIKLSQAVFMFGITVGCAVFGHISDRYGRKSSVVASAALGGALAFAVAFSQSYVMFMLLRSLSGFCFFSAFTCSFVLATEIVAPKYRVRVSQTEQAFFASGFCILALYGYFVREWRMLQIIISIPVFAISSYYWLAHESPRWLISCKRFTEANIIVQKFIRSLGVAELPSESKLLDEIVKSPEIDDRIAEKKSYHEFHHGPMDLIRTPNIRKKSLMLFYCWLVCSCVYYGLTLNAADLGGDPFINLFLSGLVEIPAVFMCIPMLDKWGRRPSLSLCLVLSGVSCVTMLFVPKSLLWLNITLSMIGKFSIAAAFGTVYIYAAELYPTPIRNVGIGVCSSFARIGGILSPFIAMLNVVAKPLPYVVFGLMSIFGGILALFLPEVLGIRLPETIKEGEEFGKNQPGPLSFIFKRLGCRGNEQEENRTPDVKYAMVPVNGAASTGVDVPV